MKRRKLDCKYLGKLKKNTVLNFGVIYLSTTHFSSTTTDNRGHKQKVFFLFMLINSNKYLLSACCMVGFDLAE
jgi:hypothetical protein